MHEYMRKMGLKETNNAIAVSGFPEEISKWIWEEEEKKGFSVNLVTTKKVV